MLSGMTSITPIITVAWSLSYEWFFYLLIPLVISGLRLRRWTSWQRIVCFLFVASSGYVWCQYHAGDHVRLVLFASGMVLWETVNFHKLRFKLRAWGEFAVILAFLLNLMAIGWVGAKSGESLLILSHVGPYFVPPLFVTVYFLELYSFFFDGFLKALFCWDYLRWVGNISYSYYLIHGLTLHGVRLALGVFFPPSSRSAVFVFALLLVSVATTLVSAGALFLVVEKPFSFRKSVVLVPNQPVARATSKVIASETTRWRG